MSLGLTTIVEAIDQRRQESVGEIVTLLHDLLARFRDNHDEFSRREDVGFGCQESLVRLSFEGSSMLLGALTKQMNVWHILPPRLTFPLLGYGFSAMVESARKFRSPR